VTGEGEPVSEREEFYLVCVGCKATTKPLRHCADDKHRCVACRRDWLDRVWATPVKAVPPSVGQQSRFDA
jgi:hypothetical protein